MSEMKPDTGAKDYRLVHKQPYNKERESILKGYDADWKRTWTKGCNREACYRYKRRRPVYSTKHRKEKKGNGKDTFQEADEP